jgi:RNA polymerase sigma-70 factor (ECF subfamily)
VPEKHRFFAPFMPAECHKRRHSDASSRHSIFAYCFQQFVSPDALNFQTPNFVYQSDVLNMATASAFPISLDSKILAGANALAPWSWAGATNAGVGARRPLDAETSLIERCLGGEQSAWEDLAKTYTKRVYGICYRFTGRENDAQDLTQDVFLRVFKSLGSFRAGEGSFAVWLTRLTRNLLVDHYRRTKHDRVTDALEDKLPTLEERTAQSSRTDGMLAGREAGELLQAALQKLSPELREAVILRDLQELEYREIAKVLDVPEGTVKSRLNRGRAELARVLRRNKVTV